ncbi:MAG TPA: DNA polymerase III subunit delta [Baekduia sp.]|nr:DNA polymerase III subunit delta [Baekduia sp.]
MPAWKTAYLVHGDDHGRIGERRAAFRSAAEAESGAGGIEFLANEAAEPAAIAATLSAMTFAMGRRFILVDGAEAFKDAEVKDHLAPALQVIAPDTTVAFFAREDGRRKAPKGLAEAVGACNGEVIHHETLKAKALPSWAQKEAARIGISLDGSGAQLLVAQVGERQQRLLRELEKLALEHGAGAQIGADEVRAAAATSSEQQVWGLVDALVALDGGQTLRRYLELADQGESVGRLVATMTQRAREVCGFALRLQAGESAAQIKASAKGSPWALDHRLREARSADVDSLRRIVEAVAQLELDTRGMSDLSEETAMVRAVVAL